MQDSELLLTFAEVAVAFAGFASLVGILGRRSARDDPRVNSVRMRSMILQSLIVVAFSLLPFVFQRYGLGDTAIWRLSSALFAAAVAVDTGWLTRHVIRIHKLHLPTRRPVLLVSTITIPTLSAATLLLAANATVVPPTLTAAVYLTGLGMLLFVAGFAFALVLFSFLGHIGSEA